MLQRNAPPKPYEFNEEVGADVMESKDPKGSNYHFLNIVDQGTTFQIVSFLGDCPNGTGMPKSRVCLEAFEASWASWAGWPKSLIVDRGSHIRGWFTCRLGAEGFASRILR